MWEYIVMGQIPGTHLQVDFTMWLLLVACPLVVWFSYRLLRSAYKISAILYHSQTFAAVRVGYVMQTAAYTQLLLTRRHIQA
jgi:hypothetical protein